MNYKDTLNLPKTKFSMKANLANLEPRMLSSWQELDIYQRLLKEREDNEKFILHDGPPYANGYIHIGHALNKILKDIVIKYKTISGYRCPYTVGWDCHGLPVEHQLFKELKLTKHDVEVIDFRKKAKDYALKFVDLQRQDFKRLGLFSDWQNPYLTVTPAYETKVIDLLKDLVKKEYVYRGRKPVNWCPKCETALAEAEVEYADKTSDSIYFLFSLIDDKGIFSQYKQKPLNFLVWTTTPWTLISNVAVAIHPDYTYVLGETDKEFIIFNKDLLESIKEKAESEISIKKELSGQELEGISLSHPFLDRESKVVLGDFVSKEDGSGCVHIAPGHGVEDFSLTKKYDLPVIMPVSEKGVFLEPKEFKGQDIKKANESVIELLKEKSRLLKHEKISHSYPHCWRCNNPIIFRATFQWFINVDNQDLRSDTLAEIDNVRWVPESGKERMRAMLTTRPDWCISRQRLWGIPIPALACKACQEVTLNEQVLARVSAVFAEFGSDSWFIKDVSEFIPGGFKCPSCGGSEFDKEYDILDVWFESGASFNAVLKNDEALGFPANLYLEGSDQHRGWFQVSLIPAVAIEKKSPFKTILTHGFVVDGEGKKMSKSLGNVIAPQKIIKNYGAEILRLWAAYTDYSEDIKISDDIVKQLVDMYRKVRNTIRFILGNISDFSLKSTDLDYSQLLEVDKYMLAKAHAMAEDVVGAYDNYSFYKVCQKIFNFCNLDLSSFYLDILKDRLYTFSQNSNTRRSAQYALYHILEILLKLISPILSFTAEEAYESWDGFEDKKDSVFIAPLNLKGLKQSDNKELLESWETILNIRSKVLKEIEKKREEGLIGSSLEARVNLQCEPKLYELLNNLGASLKEILIVSQVSLENGNFSIDVSKAKGVKCPRCWNWDTLTADQSDYPGICPKCLKTLKED